MSPKVLWRFPACALHPFGKVRSWEERVEEAPVMPAEQLPARDSPRHRAHSMRPPALLEPCSTYRCLSRPIRLCWLFTQEEGEVCAAVSWSRARGVELGVVVVLDPWVSLQRYCIPKGFGIADSWRSQMPPGPASCRRAAKVLPGGRCAQLAPLMLPCWPGQHATERPRWGKQALQKVNMCTVAAQ